MLGHGAVILGEEDVTVFGIIGDGPGAGACADKRLVAVRVKGGGGKGTFGGVLVQLVGVDTLLAALRVQRCGGRIIADLRELVLQRQHPQLACILVGIPERLVAARPAHNAGARNPRLTRHGGYRLNLRHAGADFLTLRAGVGRALAGLAALVMS